jgi:CubicO group peptidase (beta-lactamase class C family)
MKFLLVIILTISVTSYAQNKQDKKLAIEVNRLLADDFKNYTPGCAMLVAKKGRVILEAGYGLANIELAVTMKPEMVFRIGSITKQFTAVAILQLVEKGQISLSDSIQKFIKHFRYKGKTITLENLLTHTSGIKGYEQLDAKIPNAIRIDFSPQVIIDSLDKLSLEFDPGTKYNYSNSNYFILGYIIEQVTGKTYQEYLTEYILKPAGLRATFYDNPAVMIPNRAHGYSFNENKYWNAAYISMSLVYSAGALVSNAGDIFKWHQALYSKDYNAL